MKTQLIIKLAGLSLAAALLMGGPAYAGDQHNRGGGARGHAVAAVHRSAVDERLRPSLMAGIAEPVQRTLPHSAHLAREPRGTSRRIAT